MLVDELITCDPEDTDPTIRKLLPLGDFALEELARSFPGPLWRPSLVTDSRLPRPEEISASALALASFEDEAIPFLRKLLRHPTNQVRYYAALVCAERRSPDLVEPLAHLTLDDDRDCRRVALHLLSAYQHETVYRSALAWLRQSAGDVDGTLDARRWAISALTQLRDDASASLLVDLLSSPDRGLAAASRVGLRVLTAHDFGFLREPWLRWLAEHGNEIRVEWLIEGLGDGRTNIRVLASRELWRLTRFLQPLSETDTRGAFVDAQNHYRRWWSKRSVGR
ncbi:MAG: HEAT repeat domain-containing protein [Myxococcota bacterium]